MDSLEGKAKKRSLEDGHDSLYVKQSFIADDDEVDESTKDVGDADNSDEESYVFDSVCAICDNGGDILCCEGPCLRSFHPTRESGEESKCKSLGYNSNAEVDVPFTELLIQNFLCKNCLYKQHQCFGCGKLGSSDMECPEVYLCVSATCGHFYHPKCVAELLFPGSEVKASKLQKNIIEGESFICPVHKCVVCKQGEDRDVEDLQFAICRRCPKSYHRKCLPREHEIDKEIGTPIRNHIIFPEQKSKVEVLAKKKDLTSSGMTHDQTITKSVVVFSSEKIKAKEEVTKSIVQHALGSLNKERHSKDKSPFEMAKVIPVLRDNMITAKEEIPSTSAMDKITRSSFPCIDSETEALTLAIFNKVSSTRWLEDITRKHSMPSTHSSSKHIDRKVTLGRIEASVEAIRTALHKLENGASVEDAKAVCEPELLKQVVRWRENLRVYLAPFLHGMRYSSFGRHFTKVEKLKEIVEKIQWYVKDGDTVVDFCCGANDFSIFMKEKLDATGKKCNFKNYDIIQPKNDFNFERRDWMTVNTKELPTGSKLIMGLNPPFGVKASLANKFIRKALCFKPRLLVLIVPEETERLDKKKSYDLIWKDGRSLSGKAFYLPGSMDANNQQIEQWNNSPPPLYLWSRSDWTAWHREIATRHGHIPPDQQVLPSPEQERILELRVHVVAEDQLAQETGDATTSGGMQLQARKGEDNITEYDNNIDGSRKRRKPNIKENISEEGTHDDDGSGLLSMDISPGLPQPQNRNWSTHHPPDFS